MENLVQDPRRKYYRLDMDRNDLPVLLSQQGRSQEMAVMTDFAMGGAGLLTASSMQTGDTVHITIKHRDFAVRAVPCHIRHKRQWTSGIYKYGVEFTPNGAQEQSLTKLNELLTENSEISYREDYSETAGLNRDASDPTTKKSVSVS